MYLILLLFLYLVKYSDIHVHDNTVFKNEVYICYCINNEMLYRNLKLPVC